MAELSLIDWQNLQMNSGRNSGIQKPLKLQILAESRPSSALPNYTFHLTMFIISKWELWGKPEGREAICANCPCPADAAALPSAALQIPLLSGIPLAVLIWHFPCCFWDQSKHVLNVRLLQLSSCSTAYAFGVTHGCNPKAARQSWSLIHGNF